MKKPQELKSALTILFFYFVMRACATIFIGPWMGGGFYFDMANTFAMFVMLIALTRYQRKVTGLQQKQGPFPCTRDALVAAGWALALQAFTMGENALEVWFTSQFNEVAAYRFWNFHEAPRLAPNTEMELVFLLVTAAVGPFAEELYFRGLLFPTIARRRGPIVAAIATSAIFTTLHFPQPYWLSTFVFSMVACHLYLRKRSIFLCALMHAAFNVVAYLHQTYFDIHWTRKLDELSNIQSWLPQFFLLFMSAPIIFSALRTGPLFGRSTARSSNEQVSSHTQA